MTTLPMVKVGMLAHFGVPFGWLWPPLAIPDCDVGIFYYTRSILGTNFLSDEPTLYSPHAMLCQQFGVMIAIFKGTDV